MLHGEKWDELEGYLPSDRRAVLSVISLIRWTHWWMAWICCLLELKHTCVSTGTKSYKGRVIYWYTIDESRNEFGNKLKEISISFTHDACLETNKRATNYLRFGAKRIRHEFIRGAFEMLFDFVSNILWNRKLIINYSLMNEPSHFALLLQRVGHSLLQVDFIETSWYAWRQLGCGNKLLKLLHASFLSDSFKKEEKSSVVK